MESSGVACGNAIYIQNTETLGLSWDHKILFRDVYHWPTGDLDLPFTIHSIIAEAANTLGYEIEWNRCAMSIDHLCTRS
jgi:hypothetical protein